MTRRTKLALLTSVALLAGAAYAWKARGDAAHARDANVASRHREREAFAAEAISLTRTPDAAFAALRAIEIDHVLRESPAADRPALFHVAHREGGLVRRVASQSRAAPTISASGDIVLLEGSVASVVDGHTGVPLRRYELAGELAMAKVHADRVLGVTTSGRIHVWDTKTSAPIGDAYPGLATDDVELARDAPVALTCREGACTVLDHDGKAGAKLPNGRAKALSPDGKLVAIAGPSAWTLFAADGTVRATIASDAKVPRAAFAGGRLLVAGTSDVGLHDDTGKLLARLPGQLDEICEDGSVVRTLLDGSAHYFRTASGLARAVVSDGARPHAFGPRGRLAAVVDGNVVHVISTDSGEDYGVPLHGHEGAVTAVAWNADSSALVTASEDRKLRLFEARGALVTTIALDAQPAEIHLLRDAKRVVTTDLTNRDVRIHDVTVDHAIARVCELAEPHPRFEMVASICR